MGAGRDHASSVMGTDESGPRTRNGASVVAACLTGERGSRSEKTCVRPISTSVVLERGCKLFKPNPLPTHRRPKIRQHEYLIMTMSFDTSWGKKIFKKTD